MYKTSAVAEMGDRSATIDVGRRVGAVVPPGGELGPHLTQCMPPGPRPTSVPSGMFIHPTIWPQYTNVTDRQDSQLSDGVGRTVLQTVAQKLD